MWIIHPYFRFLSLARDQATALHTPISRCMHRIPTRMLVPNETLRSIYASLSRNGIAPLLGRKFGDGRRNVRLPLQQKRQRWYHKCRQVERHDYANNKAALDEHVLQILYLESGKVGEHQLDLFESIDNELSLAGVTTFLGSSISFVETLSCSLCGERQTFLGRLAQVLGHVPLLLLRTEDKSSRRRPQETCCSSRRRTHEAPAIAKSVHSFTTSSAFNVPSLYSL